MRIVRNAVCWTELLLGSEPIRDPGFMNPIGALEPPGDSGRIVWGIFVLPAGEVFVLSAGARERTRGCSPQAPGRFGQDRLGGVVSAGVRVFSLRRNFVNHGVVAQPRRF